MGPCHWTHWTLTAAACPLRRGNRQDDPPYQRRTRNARNGADIQAVDGPVWVT